ATTSPTRPVCSSPTVRSRPIPRAAPTSSTLPQRCWAFTDSRHRLRLTAGTSGLEGRLLVVNNPSALVLQCSGARVHPARAHPSTRAPPDQGPRALQQGIRPSPAHDLQVALAAVCRLHPACGVGGRRGITWRDCVLRPAA